MIDEHGVTWTTLMCEKCKAEPAIYWVWRGCGSREYPVIPENAKPEHLLCESCVESGTTVQ